MKKKLKDYILPLLSLLAVLLAGLVSYYILLHFDTKHPLVLAVTIGWVTALLIGHLFNICGKIKTKRRYAKLEREHIAQIFFKTSGIYNLGNGNDKDGMIYFCDAGIICAYLVEKASIPDEIAITNIDHITYTSNQLNIFTKDGGLCKITVLQIDELVDVLIRKGWIPPRL